MPRSINCAQVYVRAPDAAVDVAPSRARRCARGGSSSVAAALHLDDVDPLDVGVVVGPGALGQRGHVALDVARLGDVLHFVRQAVEVAEDLAQQAAADLVLESAAGISKRAAKADAAATSAMTKVRMSYMVPPRQC